MTVGENIGLYLTANRLKTAGEIAELVALGLEQAGLKGIQNRMPNELSEGMRKRVAIARALVVEPHLILYDKPTSKLDPVSSVNVARDIVRFNERIQATTLVVSHERDLAFGIAHRIAMLAEGRIIAIGTPDEIKRHPDPRVQQFLRAGISHNLPPPAICKRRPGPATKWPLNKTLIMKTELTNPVNRSGANGSLRTHRHRVGSPAQGSCRTKRPPSAPQRRF
jgi:ABC-type transporter Mla maintaining outer membrane lipid asymmetry ATPase subunit MlaF